MRQRKYTPSRNVLLLFFRVRKNWSRKTLLNSNWWLPFKDILLFLALLKNNKRVFTWAMVVFIGWTNVLVLFSKNFFFKFFFFLYLKNIAFAIVSYQKKNKTKQNEISMKLDVGSLYHWSVCFFLLWGYRRMLCFRFSIEIRLNW